MSAIRASSLALRLLSSENPRRKFGDLREPGRLVHCQRGECRPRFVLDKSSTPENAELQVRRKKTAKPILCYGQYAHVLSPEAPMAVKNLQTVAVCVATIHGVRVTGTKSKETMRQRECPRLCPCQGCRRWDCIQSGRALMPISRRIMPPRPWPSHGPVGPSAKVPGSREPRAGPSYQNDGPRPSFGRIRYAANWID